MAWRRIKRRSSRRFVIVERLLWPAIFVIAGVSIWFALPRYRETAPMQPFSPNGSGAGLSSRPLFSTEGGRPPIGHRESSVRVVYHYSVIPGGVTSVEELRKAIAQDPVVSAHYTAFHLSRARIIHLDRARSVHVSYRLGNRVYWTKRKLKLAKGERLITDGFLTARTRCGNLISAELLPPVSPSEPSVQEMDIPEVPRDLNLQLGNGPQPDPPVTQTSGSGSPPPNYGYGYAPIIFGFPGSPVSRPSPPPPPLVVTTPEPSSLVLLLTGLFFLLLLCRRGVLRIRHRVP